MAPKAILIVPPDPHWAARFLTLATPIRTHLPAGAQLHHIGSTSVPGLSAKNVIDVQIGLPDLSSAAAVLVVLDALGYPPRPAVTADHLPPGQTLDPRELAKAYAARPQDVHVHIREVGRFNHRYPLLMRDFLRAAPPAAAAYGEVKRQLAQLHPQDAEAYYAVKDPVMDLIIAGAEQWARRTGWTLPASDA
ncbi:GrpB family protein [Deinococcus taeanensis]|uniref:GrpB family protein n=1 Tax=Deinococcus taeanensis TaxID=2737050 RepID=UPI001CDB4CC2|nr:GrpB family protein [Deinococcus taeanensis]UBV41797.1 GrpB family protein [Deinococcus taeanensis]